MIIERPVAALFLIANGFLLLIGDWLRTRSEARFARERRVTVLGWRGALVVGIWYPTDAPASPHPVGTFVQDVVWW